MAATLKVQKQHAPNVYVRLVNGLHEPYQALSFPWATGPLTLLESIAKVPDREVTKTIDNIPPLGLEITHVMLYVPCLTHRQGALVFS